MSQSPKQHTAGSPRTVTSSANPATYAAPTSILWVDCEMTGLEDTDVILEVAAIATDGDLNVIRPGRQWVVKRSKERLDAMGEWCQKQHSMTGLIDQCIKSQWSISAVDAMVLSYARECIPRGKILLAGSSVHVDKQFIKRDLPRLHNHLHYRVLDVSTIKEVVRRWYPNMPERSTRVEAEHRALSDIQASIDELKWYRQQVFKAPSEVLQQPTTASLPAQQSAEEPKKDEDSDDESDDELVVITDKLSVKQ